jgi:hypothetical protein
MLWRQVIRDTTVGLLLNTTDAGPRVYTSPILPLRRDRVLPAISVYTLTDVVTPLGESGPWELEHNLDVAIECVVEFPTDPNDSADQRLTADAQVPLDQLCEQVEAQLAYKPQWYRPLLIDIVRSTTRITPASVQDADRRTMSAVITYTVAYVEICDPQIDDQLNLVDIQIDVIDPAADPNVTGHPTAPPDGYPGGYPGPDGRIEVHLTVPKTGTLWPLLRGRSAREWRDIWRTVLFPRFSRPAPRVEE